MPFPSVPVKQGEMENINPHESAYKKPDVDLLNEKQWRYIQRRYNISPREIDVAKLVCQGLSNKDIATKLNIKLGTVNTHLKSIFGKTRVTNKITMLLRFIEDTANLFPKLKI
jgi:DNA-binding NarL/FixJ family response regulator